MWVCRALLDVMGHARSPVVGVIGSTGGVGASSFACALAVGLRAGVLVDLDWCGGGLDTMLGLEGVSGARWSDLHVAGGAIDPVDLARGLPRWRGVPVLAADGGAAPPAAVSAVLDAGRALGPLVIDSGRCLCADSITVLRQCDVVVLVAEAEARAVAAVRAITRHLDGMAMGLVARRGTLPRSEVHALTQVAVLGMLAPLGRRPGVRMSRTLLRVAGGVAKGLVSHGAAGTDD